jgi:lysophospholipase L1-like esterase
MSATNVLNVATNTQGTGVSRRLLVIGDSTVVNGSLVSEINRMMGTNSTYTLTLIGKGGGGGGTNWHEGFDNRRWEYLKQVALSRFAKVDGTFDFNYYLTNNSLTMESGDWVVFQLGINDIFSWSTNDALVTERLSLTQSNVYTIVTNINGVVPGIRVGIAVTIPPAESADGLGVSNGTGIDLPRYRRSLHRLNEMYCGWEGWLSIYLVPIHANLDAQNSFPLGNQVVNGRSEVQRPWILDTIHPGSVGYSQMADTYYAFLKWHQ